MLVQRGPPTHTWGLERRMPLPSNPKSERSGNMIHFICLPHFPSREVCKIEGCDRVALDVAFALSVFKNTCLRYVPQQDLLRFMLHTLLLFSFLPYYSLHAFSCYYTSNEGKKTWTFSPTTLALYGKKSECRKQALTGSVVGTPAMLGSFWKFAFSS